MLPARRLLTCVCSGLCKRQLAHYPPYTQKLVVTDKEQLFPHKDFLQKLYDQGDKKYAEYHGETFEYDKHHLRYNEREVLDMLQTPEIQDFLDNLMERELDQVKLKDRVKEARKGQVAEHFIQNYPDCLLDMDPFNYLREEEYFANLEKVMNPVDDKQRSTGQITNPVHRKRFGFSDFPYRWGKHGWDAVSDLFKVWFSQSTSVLRKMSRDMRARGFDHGTSDRRTRGEEKKLAFRLQDIYLKHYECAQEGDFDKLLYFMADKGVCDLREKYGPAKVNPRDLKLLFHFELIENLKPPKIVSYFHQKTQGHGFLQALVRFEMRVRCLGAPRDDGSCHLEEQEKVQYAVFERDIHDWTSTYVLVNKISEEDIEYFRTNLWNEENIRERFPEQ